MSVTRARSIQLAQERLQLHRDGCSFLQSIGEELCDCPVLRWHPENTDQGTLYGVNGRRISRWPKWLHWMFK